MNSCINSLQRWIEKKKFRLPFAESVGSFDVAWLEQVPEELVDAYDQAVEEYQAALTQVMEQALNHLIDEVDG